MRRLFVGHLLAGMVLVSTGAQAEATRFLCSTEEATNSVAEKLVVSQGAFTETGQIWLVGTLAPQSSATLTFRGIVRIPPNP